MSCSVEFCLIFFYKLGARLGLSIIRQLCLFFSCPTHAPNIMYSKKLYFLGLLVKFVEAAINVQQVELDFAAGGTRVCQYCAYCWVEHYCDGPCDRPQCVLCHYRQHCASTCKSAVCKPLPCSKKRCGANETCYETYPGRGECRCNSGVVCNENSFCISMANRGDCEFYTCFENRRRCGSSGYMLQYGRRYCNKFSEHYDKFTEAGKQWLVCARQCLTNALTDSYLSNVPAGYECDRVRSLAFRTNVDCYINCGFCDIWSTNKRALFRVYRLWDFVQHRAHVQATSVVYRCFSDAMRSIYNETLDSITSLWRRRTSFLRSRA